MKSDPEGSSAVIAEVIENRCVAPGHFRISLALPGPFATPQPGQFVMVRDPLQEEPLLPRPLSVYAFGRGAGGPVLDLLYRVAGRGTTIFSQLRPGAPLSVLGPLGRGFTLQPGRRTAVLLAGGVGVAPLSFLLHGALLGAGTGPGPRIVAYVGARTAECLTGIDRFKGFCDLRLATDDGSAGFQGLVTDLFGRELNLYDPGDAMIYACGPAPMIRALGRLLTPFAFGCEVSLEERMACGIGACLGCAVEITDKQGDRTYRRVCHDGPVFDLRALFRGRIREDERDGVHGT